MLRLGKVLKRAAVSPEYSANGKLFHVRLLNADGTLTKTEFLARDSAGALEGDTVFLLDSSAPYLIIAVVKNAAMRAREEIPELEIGRVV